MILYLVIEMFVIEVEIIFCHIRACFYICMYVILTGEVEIDRNLSD